MISIPMFEVKNKLTQFVHMVENGETDCVEITRHGKAVAIIGKKEEFKITEQQNPFYMAYSNFRDKLKNLESNFSEEEWQDYFEIPRPQANLRHPGDFE